MIGAAKSVGGFWIVELPAFAASTTCCRYWLNTVAACFSGAYVNGRATTQMMSPSRIRARTRFHQPESTTPSGVVASPCDCQPC